jgi:hypothetical protein
MNGPNSILESRYLDTPSGKIRSHIFNDSKVIIGFESERAGINSSIHITREEAIQLSRNLEEIVAAYDATVDRYHEVCDEPVAAEVR